MLEKIKNKLFETKILLRSIPSLYVTMFCVSIIAMNLLANKSINLPVDWLALDAGIFVSWMSFLFMDIITKHFGLKAANTLTIVGVIVNLIMCLLFFIISIVPGMWSESYIDGYENIINNALDNTFGGTWFVLLGSTIAFIGGGIINNTINFFLGKLLKKDNALSFFLRTYVSTAIGQFCDNLIFALIVSLNFFGWTFIQCLTCAITGMIVELLCEVIFSHFGYYICKKWKKDNVGEAYFKLINKEQ